MQTILYWMNFTLNVYFFGYINIDYLYFYYVHNIGYSSGFLKKLTLEILYT